MRVIVMTCDKNQWVLPIFWHFQEKYWPDCPWPITVVGGPKTESDLDDYEVYRGDDATFSGLLLEYIQEMDDDDFLLILLEDYILMGPVDTDRVMTCYDIIRVEPEAQFMRLTACPGPTLEWEPDWKVGQFDKGIKEELSYLSSLMPTIWRVSHLRRLLRPGESAWDIEVAGSERARDLPGIYLGSTETLLGVQNYLWRGKARAEAVKEVEEKW